MTTDQMKRLKELAIDPCLPLQSDHFLLKAVIQELENPRYFCGECHYWHRRGECSVANNDEDYG
jgi:hypothetical protein